MIGVNAISRVESTNKANLKQWYGGNPDDR